MGCDYNRGPGWWRVCDAGRVIDGVECCTGGRRLTEEDNDETKIQDFNIDVCMDDISPLDPSSTYYMDYATM
jgi:hypothetical protein